ncbi:hypothetical protein [Mucilaginibacter terrae]|uniref:Uncharacterized protein n=1 Tax=Mucilaginibacter terrae TaxID=1955052 RepID=A0ABU3GR80_9SPHI|nr:hypothetical protein [Mucilaginibacter terrae]MDT3402284.1 hypothetical protein [Mucilaginibacter terrae]
MKSKLFEDRPKTAKTSTERWIRIFPDNGEGYQLYDVFREHNVGRILFDVDANWIYDGDELNVDEQEDVAGSISGNVKEMNALLKDIL